MKKYSVIIFGSGPAGGTAGIYCGRSNLKTLLITGDVPGGQLTQTTEVENYPGFTSIQGPELMENMQKHAKTYGCEIIIDQVSNIDFSNQESFTVKCSSGDKYETKAIIICTGAEAKWLGLKSEQEFLGFGVSACATCDGIFYKNQNVIVVGGGNTAVEEALYLTKHAKKITLVHRRNKLRAEPILQDRLQKYIKKGTIEMLWDHTLEEILGDKNTTGVTGAILQNTNNKQTKKMQIDGVFIAIGHRPNTEIFKNKIKMDSEGYIITSPNSTATNIRGVFAAGDVQDKIYRQAITAAGTGCMAAIEAFKYLEESN